MICPNCGTELRESDRFCGQCGNEATKSTINLEKESDSQERYDQGNTQGSYQNSYQGNYQQGQQSGYQQPYQPVDMRKSRVVAGILQIVLGWAGVGRFYLGYNSIGVAQLLVSLFTCGLGTIWPFIDGILILSGQVPTDADGLPLKD